MQKWPYFKYRLFILFFCASIFAQNSVINPSGHKHPSFNRVNLVVEGEEIFGASVITQDHKGYMWMVTNVGLIRYNGIEGKKYSINVNGNSIFHDEIKALFVDSRDNLWIGSSSGLSRYDSAGDSLTLYPHSNNETELDSIMSIAEDQNNDLWIGTFNDGLFKYHRKDKVFERIFNNTADSISLVKENIECLLVDQNNNLWIGLNTYNHPSNNGLIRLNIDSGSVKQFFHEPENPNSLISNRIKAIYEDQEGQILVGTHKCGLHIYDIKEESFNRINFDPKNPNKLHASYTEVEVFSSTPYVGLIHQDKNGGYWIGTSAAGINYFDTKTNTYKNYNFNLTNPQLLWSIFEDNKCNIWIGGILGAGLYKSDLFERKYTYNKFFTNVEAAYESPYNPRIIWVKSRQQGLYKWNLTTNEITQYMHDKNNSKSIGHNWVRAVHQENERILWVGLGFGGTTGRGSGDGGIARMDIETGEFTHFKLTRNDDGFDDFSYTVFHLGEDHEGKLWASTGPGGLFRSDKYKKEFKHVDLSKTDNSLKDARFFVVRVDSNGNIWASDFRDEGTLYLFNHDKDTFEPYLPGFKPTNVVVDNKGWLLISTWRKGLLHLNPADKKYKHYTKKDGLPSNDASDIAKYEDGIYWIGTRMGPAKFDSKSGKITSVGLPMGRYNYGICKSGDNQIYVGYNDGLLSFHPDQVLGNPFPPDVVIESINLPGNFSNLLSINSEILLAHDQNDLTFEYAGLHFSNSASNEYRYILEPYDTSWINAGIQRTARYTNLDPGDYTFQVIASNSDGVWNKKGALINLVINNPWWQTYPAYFAYFLIGFGLLYSLRRYELNRQNLKYNLKLGNIETEKLKEIDQVKSRFFANISHEFRTPLTLILGPAKDISENVEDVKVRKRAGIIQKNATKLYELVNQLLDLSKLEAGKMKLEATEQNIIPLIKGLVLSFTSLAERKKITLNFESAEESINAYIDKDKIEKIINNILSNAFKFTPEGGIIECKILKLDSEIEISVKDSGIGIPKERIDRIFDRFYQVDESSTREGEGTGIGLALTKELVELHKGSISAKSEVGKGTVFILQIPLGREHLKDAEIVTNGLLEETITTIDKSEINSGIEGFEEKSNVNGLLLTDLTGEKEGKPVLLIVEDNFDVRNYIVSHLEEDYKIVEATDGKDGFSKSIEQFPDLIISDVMMPKMDGFQLCEKLKTDERTSHIPIILLTAKAASENKIEGYETGADDYIKKPFDTKELQVRIKNLINQRKQLRKHFQKEGIFNLEDKEIKSVDKIFLEKAVKIINENIAETSFGVEAFASNLAISRAALHKKLVSLIGEPPSELIKRIRLSQAGNMLKNKTGNISEIALEVGFNNPAYFAECFKKQFGLTPSQYQRNINNN